MTKITYNRATRLQTLLVVCFKVTSKIIKTIIVIAVSFKLQSVTAES